MDNSKNFKLGKFKKFAIRPIQKKIQFGYFQKFSFLKYLKILVLENSKNVQFIKFEKFVIWKIKKNLQCGKFEKFVSNRRTIPKLPILITKLWFSKLKKISRFLNFSIWTIPKISNLGNSKNLHFGQFKKKKIQFGYFQKFKNSRFGKFQKCPMYKFRKICNLEN